MTNPKGELRVTAREQEYTLFLSMSVIAALQAKHGQDVLEKIEPPADAGPNWMPDLSIVCDIIEESLQRYHSDVADRWVVDDIIGENDRVMEMLMAAAFPTPSGGDKMPAGKKKAAASR